MDHEQLELTFTNAGEPNSSALPALSRQVHHHAPSVSDRLMSLMVFVLTLGTSELLRPRIKGTLPSSKQRTGFGNLK